MLNIARSGLFPHTAEWYPFPGTYFFHVIFKYRVELLNCAQESFLCFGLSYIIQNQCNDEKHCAVARIKNKDRFID